MHFLRCFLVVALLGLTACVSKPPKGSATLRMHLPASPALQENRRVPVALRTPAIIVQVDSFPALTEGDLDKAELTGEGENFAIRLGFNTHGTIELDRLSLQNRGQMLVILINGVPVAAPVLKQRIVDGIFEFTPDLTRADAEKIVKGLNSSIAYLRKNPM